MTSTTVQETQTSTTTSSSITVSSSTSTSPLQKLRQIAPAPTGKPEYDVYHIPKGYEVFLVSKNENSADNLTNTNTTDSNPIPLSPTCSISSSSSTCSTSKIIAPKPITDNNNNNNNKSQSSWRKRKNNGHIPRPKNCFMAYREHMQHKVLAENPGMNNKLVSVIAAKMWNNEPEETKQIWRERAQQLKIEHMNKYPDYKFAPKKKVPKNLGLKTPKSISKKSNNNKILNEELAKSILLRRDEYNQSSYYPSHHNESPLWVGHCRSNSVESVSSWTSSDSIPNTPPTYCDRTSPLRYETNDWKMYDYQNDFSSLNSSPHLTAVPTNVFDTLLMPNYDDSMQVGSSPESSYYDTHEENEMDQYDEFIQPNPAHYLDSFVLQHPAPMQQMNDCY